MFSGYHWEACSFLKGKEKAIEPGEREGGEDPGGVEEGKAAVGMHCMREE